MLYNANCYFSPVAEEKLIADDLIVQAREATDEDLLVVHTRRYLNKLKVLYPFMCFSSKLVQSECQKQWVSCRVVINQLYRYRMVYVDHTDNVVTENTERKPQEY